MQRRLEQLFCRLRHVRGNRIAAVLVFGLLLAGMILLLQVDVVTVTDSFGGSRTLLSLSKSPRAVAEMAGAFSTPNSEVKYISVGDSLTAVLINRSYPVDVKVDGVRLRAVMPGGKPAVVAEVLKKAGIPLGEFDYAQPPPDATVARGATIEVHRVEYVQRGGRYEVLKADVQAFIDTMDNPDSFVYSKSRIYDVWYEDKLVDGVVTESRLAGMDAVYHPYDAPSAGPVQGVPMSSIDGFVGVSLDANGLPTSYTRVLRGATATAYSSSGGKGAGGQGLYCGTVAVNPNIIPYGTRLYIVSPTGRFIYGWAIASDTGIALMDGRVDVDMYFETNAECRAFGKRAVDVYILD